MSELEDRLKGVLSSPEKMEQIMALAKSFGTGEQSKPEPEKKPAKQPSQKLPDVASIIEGASQFGDIDPKLFRIMSRLIGEYNTKDNDKSGLIRAMKPFLKDEKKRQLDRALELTKLARAAKLALGEMEGGLFNF